MNLFQTLNNNDKVTYSKALKGGESVLLEEGGVSLTIGCTTPSLRLVIRGDEWGEGVKWGWGLVGRWRMVPALSLANGNDSPESELDVDCKKKTKFKYYYIK